MKFSQKFEKFIKDKYKNYTDQIYLFSLIEEIKKTFSIDSAINIDSLVQYLIDKGYSNLLAEYEPIRNKNDDRETENTNHDFSLDSFFKQKNNDDELIRMLNSFQDNRVLFEKLFQETDQNRITLITDQIILNNQKLVIKAASRYLSISKSLTLDDLINEGNLGLIKAVQKYDLNRGFEFSTYALFWIKQSILRAIADKSNIIRIPVHALEDISKIRKVERKFEFENKNFTPEDILKELGNLSFEKYLKLKEIEFKFLHDTSLNQALGSESDEELIEFITNDSETYGSRNFSSINIEEIVLQRDLLNTLTNELNKLKDKEREIIEYRFGLIDGEIWTLEEIGKLYGVTRERIRQIESKALTKLQNKKVKNKLIEYIRN